jgi:tetratricopeptide (TPR) repeat protein
MPAWMQWGAMLLVASKLWQDADCLRASVVKLQEGYRLAPDSSAVIALFAEALGFLGMHEENADFIKQADALVREAIQTDFNCAELYAAHASILCNFAYYFSEEKYVTQALEQISFGMMAKGPCELLYYRLAVAKFLLSEFHHDVPTLEEALDAFQVASKTDVGRFGHFWNEWGVALLTIANITFDKKYLHEAQEKFERAITIHTRVLPEWLYNYGCTLNYLGDVTDNESYYERALQALTNAITLDPTHLAARFHLAQSYSHLGILMDDIEAFQEAIRHFQLLIEQDPEDDLAWIEWGVTLMRLTELTRDDTLMQDSTLLDVAEMNFLQALMLGNDEASYHIACLYSYQGNISDAMYYFEKAIENDVLPPLELVLEDEWLENLRKTTHFKDLIRTLDDDEL